MYDKRGKRAQMQNTRLRGHFRLQQWRFATNS